MFRNLLRTDRNLAGLVIRLALGIVMFPHGAQKVLGWYGGQGFAATMDMFTHKMGIPALFALLAIIAEFFGSIGLIVGFLTRVAAFGIACVMVVAVWMVHLPHGFFMNWFGKQAGEGFEYHILAFALAVAAMIRGGGLWSLDGIVANRRQKRSW